MENFTELARVCRKPGSRSPRFSLAPESLAGENANYFINQYRLTGNRCSDVKSISYSMLYGTCAQERTHTLNFEFVSKPVFRLLTPPPPCLHPNPLWPNLSFYCPPPIHFPNNRRRSNAISFYFMDCHHLFHFNGACIRRRWRCRGRQRRKQHSVVCIWCTF